jgi:hypothetical protein
MGNKKTALGAIRWNPVKHEPAQIANKNSYFVVQAVSGDGRKSRSGMFRNQQVVRSIRIAGSSFA